MPPIRPQHDAATATSAARFRALMLVGGRPAGSAGMDPRTGERKYPERPGAVHFGGDASSIDAGAGDPVWVRSAFLALAEDMIAVEGGALPLAPAGVSDADDAARWDALMRMPRIRVWRHSGTIASDGTISPEGGDFAFFAEYWTHGEEKPGSQDDPREGRLCLTLLADLVAARTA